MRNKRGMTILLENVIFISLNLVFLSILVLFVVLKVNNVAISEEIYAKQIALIVDSAKPGMAVNLNMEKAFKKMEKGFALKDIVSIDNENNLVEVKLRQDGGYSYAFFNDADVSAYPDDTGKNYIIIINENET